MKLKIVPLADATNAELQSAAHFCGFDEMGFKYVEVLDKTSDAITVDDRAFIIKRINECGYTRIRIDKDNRLTNADVLHPAEVAEPLTDEAK